MVRASLDKLANMVAVNFNHDFFGDIFFCALIGHIFLVWHMEQILQNFLCSFVNFANFSVDSWSQKTSTTFFFMLSKYDFNYDFFGDFFFCALIGNIFLVLHMEQILPNFLCFLSILQISAFVPGIKRLRQPLQIVLLRFLDNL